MTTSPQSTDFPTTLISAQALMALIAGGLRPVIIDCSFDLTDGAAGARSFAEAHLPGAHYAHLERDLSGPKSPRGAIEGGRHPLPSPAAFAATLGAWGVAPTTPVVVYDRQGATFAARAWWMLRWLGHGAVAVLDGGLQAWQAAGGALAHGADAAEPAGQASATADGPASAALAGPASAAAAAAGPYPLPAGLGIAIGAGDTGVASPAVSGLAMPTIDAATLLGRPGRMTVIDARAGERFRGESEPLDARAGHIPGARNRFFKDNLGADGRFKPAAALRAAFEAFGSPPASVVHQCGSGVTACHNLLAMEHAGLTGSVLYPGSWSEWSADPARPVAVG
jgi:thiosulfate/3-mercaptopyruvate sulfurtransferase